MADHRSKLSISNFALQQVDIWNDTGSEALARALGLTLPAEMGHITERNGIRVARLTPRRYWVFGERPPVMLAPDDGAMQPLDQGRVCLSLSGRNAREILSQLMAIDWADARAAPERLVLSAIHRVPVAVLPLAVDRYDILVPRSFAESISELITELQVPAMERMVITG